MSVHRLMHRTRVLVGLPPATHLLLLESLALLLWCRLLARWFPLRLYGRWLGELHAETPRHPAPPRAEAIRQIGWSVATASAILPWRDKCLIEAMAAKLMLRRRGAPTTLYIGAHRAPARGVIAHSWLRCGDQTVTGGDGIGYAVVASYADLSRERKEVFG